MSGNFDVKLPNVSGGARYDETKPLPTSEKQSNNLIITVSNENSGKGYSIERRSNPFDIDVDEAALQKKLGKTQGLLASQQVSNVQTELSVKYTEISSKLNRICRDFNQSPEVRSLAAECLAELQNINFQKGYPKPAEKGNKALKFSTFQNDINNYKKASLEKMEQLIEDYDLMAVLGEVRQSTDKINNTTAEVGTLVIANQEQVKEELSDQIDARADGLVADIQKEGAKTRGVVHSEGAKTRAAVHSEGAQTRKVVREEGAQTRVAVHVEGAITRIAVHNEGEETRKVVRKEGNKTRDVVAKESAVIQDKVQEHETLDAYEKKIQNVLILEHLPETKVAVSNLCTKIVQANIPGDKKIELMRHLASFSTQRVITSKELEAEEKLIDKAIKSR